MECEKLFCKTNLKLKVLKLIKTKCNTNMLFRPKFYYLFGSQIFESHSSQGGVFTFEEQNFQWRADY